MRRLDWRTLAALGGIFALALAVRLTWTLLARSEPPFLSDPEYYRAAALSISRGEGFSVTFDSASGFLPGGDPTAFWPPGYSIYLSVWHAILGENILVGQLANVATGSLTVVPAYFIGRRLFDERAAILGAGIVALLPSLIVWTPVLFSETLFTLLFGTALALTFHTVRADGSMRMLACVACAAAIGLGALVRGQMLVLLPLLAVWWLLRDGRIGNALPAAALITLIAASFIGAWTVRNAIVMGEPILISANFGYNLRIGHADYSTGRYLVPQDLWGAEPGLTFHERELLFNEEGTNRAIDYALASPQHELELSGRKIVSLWRPDADGLDWAATFGRTPIPADGAWRVAVGASYFVLLGLACVGLVGQHRRIVLFVTALFATWTLMHIVFFSEPRYHVPMLVVLAPLAAAGVLRVVAAGASLCSVALLRPKAAST